MIIGYSRASSAVVTTWNPADTGANITFANGNLNALKASGNAAWTTVRATAGKSTGKRYFEIKSNTNYNYYALGIAVGGGSLENIIGTLGVDSAGYIQHALDYLSEGGIAESANTNNPTIVLGDVIGFAVDLDTGKIWLSLNGSYTAFRGSADPAAGTNTVFTFTPPLTLFPAVSLYGSQSVDALLAASGTFATAPPSGFTAWNA